ncbi:MAG: pyridoxine 5'-phosphate synthase [Bacteroidia bacterium]|nr:pyridoxine 5'-phosphate synthase [Bacteroidia bacterium]
MIALSVNVNKVALLRNSRGHDFPNVQQIALDCVRFGADGITIHPRPDGRHIRKADAYSLKEILPVELNIEGYPSEDFLKMVCEIKPAQCTLVPDPPNALTSSFGWDTINNQYFLREVVSRLQDVGIRVSLFIDPVPERIIAAADTGTNRIELYTGPYATRFPVSPDEAITDYIVAATTAQTCGLGINAGHDLSSQNLRFFANRIPGLLEVSIGHALIGDALYWGLEKTIQIYKSQLQVH